MNKGFRTVEFWDSNANLSPLFSKVTTFKDIGFGPQELYEYFTLKYFDRPMAREYNDEDKESLITWFKKMVAYVVLRNKYKYETLLGTVGLDYNPIENYNMVELTGEFTKNGGTTQTNSAQQGSGPTTINSVSQYDTEAFSNSSKSETYGTTTTTTEHENIDDTIAAKDNAYGNEVTEIDAIGGRKLTRSGNIGVTTTQQMLESERELARLSIIDEFMDDVKKEILLGIYED